MKNSTYILDEKLTIKEQREKLLELNPDLLFGVYNLVLDTYNETGIELCKKVLTCYPDQLKNLNGLDKFKDITILDINKLRKGELEVLVGKEINIDTPVLLSNGTIDYVVGDTGKKHIITTLRDGGASDNAKRTTTAGRNISQDLNIESIREHIEESPFLGKNSLGEYALATISKNQKDLEILIESIKSFIKNKTKLDRDNPDDLKMIKTFERNFKGISYEQLPDILIDILKNNRFMLYYTDSGSINGLEKDTKYLKMYSNLNVVSKGKFIVFFDRDNNTIEYRNILEIKGFEEGFQSLSKRPGRLYLESLFQYPRIPDIKNAHKVSSLVPTIEHVSKKAGEIIN